ncbi:MAG TPA: PaaI family thioesterase [Rhizobiaceae bacterium]|nr:PaaI family thioesterase [Rhizobiaceae bacterium]
MSKDTLSSYRGGIFQHLGLQMTHSQEGRMTGQLEVGPHHLNRAGYVHGGVLCTMIDFGACTAGLHAEPGEPLRFGVTLALTTNFTKAVNSGTLTVEGKVISAGRKTYTAEARVLDASGDLVAHGIGTFQWRRGSVPAATKSQQQSHNG